MSYLDGVEVHPAADLFPLMKGEEFDELVADIREHGVREPVVFTPDDKLLDGRNRWRACKKLGDEPPRRVEHSEPWAFAISANIHRRHLTPSQLQMIGARLAQRSRGGSNKIVLNPSNEEMKTIKDQPPTREQVAKLLGVGHAGIDRARQVIERGTEDLQQAVDSGEIKVHTANRVVRKLGPDEQNEFVRKVRAGADATKLAADLGVPNNYGTGGWKETKQDEEPEEKFEPEPIEEAWERDPRSRPKRKSYLTADAVASLCTQLEAMAMVVSTAEGLDPSITSEAAARWLGSLTQSRGSLNRVMKLLTERKGSGK